MNTDILNHITSDNFNNDKGRISLKIDVKHFILLEIDSKIQYLKDYPESPLAQSEINELVIAKNAILKHFR
jgi:hypothetical protein